MTAFRRLLAGVGATVFLLLAAPPLLAAVALLLAVADLISLFAGRRDSRSGSPASKDAVSVVIPTWNQREMLARNLPSVVTALADSPDHEILVMDNGSEDGTARFLASEFPSVRVVEIGSNLGFGLASNAALTLARHDIVVMLNNDMRVEPDFLQPLLDGFRDPRVFSVTAQIHFADSSKRREETGLTTGRWHRGRIHLRHVADHQVDELFPTFYTGGGSTAYDRLKILELGGFDELFEPFYMEDVDLAYLAWKRGWINLYAPGSVVFHEHRGTIGSHFGEAHIQRVLQRNRLLFTWKNIHDWRLLVPHFGWLYADLWIRLLGGRSQERPGIGAFADAAWRSIRAVAQRVAARRLAQIPDLEALRRPLGGFFRDRYHRLETRSEGDLNVLFVSPYPFEPPRHGGAVLMKQAVEGLAKLCRLHILCLAEREEDIKRHEPLGMNCTSVEMVLHDPRQCHGAPMLWPHAARSYWDPDLVWRIHRTILKERIDIVQLEYTQLAAYGESFRQIVCCLFEHDLHFESVQRAILGAGPLDMLRRAHEYLRALRFELQVLTRFDTVQVCSGDQRETLQALLDSDSRVREGLRDGIDVASYPFRTKGREPDTVLFVGSFRHPPNLEALEFFRERILPVVRQSRPAVRLVVAGADAPAPLRATLASDGSEVLGEVPEIRDVLGRYAVFVAPIRSGSGIRVKILEAFACGIPVVTTSLGAEGLQARERGTAEVEDKSQAFAEAVVRILKSPGGAANMVRSARLAVEREWNAAQTVPRLLAHYRATLETKLLSRPPRPLPLQ